MTSTHDVPSFGFSSSAWWLVFDVRHSNDDWVLSIDYAPLQHIDVYQYTADGKPLHHFQGGSAVPVKDRALIQRRHLFPIAGIPDSVDRFLIRIQTEGSATVPAALHKASPFFQYASLEYMGLGLYLGVLVALIIYNLFIGIVVRESTYFVYCVFVTGMVILFVGITGLGQAHIWPNNPAFSPYVLSFGMALALASATSFSSQFLDLRQHMPRTAIVLRGFTWYFVIMCVAVWLLPYKLRILAVFIPNTLASGLMLLIAIYASLRNLPAARLYLAAWIAMLVGTIINFLRLNGMVETGFFTEYIVFIGAGIQGILLSVALAARMRTLKDESERSQEEALSSKQMALDIVQKYSARLEDEVIERTAELVATQKKLVAQEKMSALGVFTAGMAHEINNPANFVSVGAQNISAQVEEFNGFVNDLLDDEADPEIREAFSSRLTSLRNSSHTVRTGIDRIQRVVAALRAAHPEGNAGRLPTDIVATLDNAWELVQGGITLKIDVERNYEARPSMAVVVAEMHQVFLALLTNAVHALEDAVTQRSIKPRITLSSRAEDNDVEIAVEDNGVGMDEATLSRAFDPFYTRKEVGRGSGLGLSMARDVVHQHGGQLLLESIVNVGTRAVLRLPMNRSGD